MRSRKKNVFDSHRWHSDSLKLSVYRQLFNTWIGVSVSELLWKLYTPLHMRSTAFARGANSDVTILDFIALTLLNKAHLISITPAGSVWVCVCECNPHTRCLTPSLSRWVAKWDILSRCLSKGWWACRGLRGVVTFNWAVMSAVVKQRPEME